MPEPVQSSWADEIEDSDVTQLPQPSEKIKGNLKTVTEYILNDQEKKVKIVRTYKIEKKMVPKAIAERKTWSKFGMSRSDKPGPNPQTTVVAEEIWMQFVANKEEAEKEQEMSAIDKIKASTNKLVKCRICKEDHWTTQCPYKDTLGPIKDSLNEAGRSEDPATPTLAAAGPSSTSGKYVPPSKREGSKPGASDSGPGDRRGGRNDDTAAIRISNLSEQATDSDLQNLCRDFGSIARIFLAKDKQTNKCKGFAFVNFYKKEDAAKAIATLNGFGYDHLILSVEWAKPSTDR